MPNSARRLPALAAVACVVLGLSARAASAATTYYVTENADVNNTTCSQAAPCPLFYALSNVGTVGDTIEVGPGLYNLIADAQIHAGVSIVGPSNGGASVVNGATDQSHSLMLTLAEGASISGLQLSSIAVTFGEGTTATNMDIRAIHTACNIVEPDVTINGSVCQGFEGGSTNVYPAVEVKLTTGNGTVQLRNDVFFGTRRAFDVNAPVAGETINATNDIMRAADTSACPINLVGPNGTSDFVTVNLMNDNYDNITTGLGGCGGDGLAVHLNQITSSSSDPALANMVDNLNTANFRETSSSPTRGAGYTNGILPSERDADGHARLIGPADSPSTDVGAYQLIDPPTASAAAPTGLTASSVTLHSIVAGKGLPSSSTYTYGTDPNPANWTIADAINDPPTLTNQTVSDSLTLTGLTPDTVYHWQLCTLAGNSSACTGAQTFTTLTPPPPPPPPVITGGTATGIGTTSATLGATVNPSGLAATAHFEFGTTTAYGTGTPTQTLSAGSVDQPVTAALSGLSPGTVYHARVVATNSGGTTQGTDFTFITTASVTPDHTPPYVTLLARKLKLRTARAAAALQASCAAPVGQTCTVVGSLYGAGKLPKATATGVTHTGRRKPKRHPHTPPKLGTASATIAPGTTGSLVLKLNKKARAALAHERSLVIQIVAVVFDQAGQSNSLTGTVKLNLKQRHKHHKHKH